jgi:hypothetical protein
LIVLSLGTPLRVGLTVHGRSLRALIQVLEARLPLAGRDPPLPGGRVCRWTFAGHVAKVLSRPRRETGGTIPPPMMLTDERCQATPMRMASIAPRSPLWAVRDH